MRIRKNVLMLSLIASFLMSMAVVPSYATMATLYVEPADIVGTDPFVIVVYVDDVANMFGYQFKLTYDSDVLTCVDFVSFAPFTVAQGIPPGGYIDDAKGFVEIYYSHPMAEPDGLTTDVPVQIAGFAFTVDGPGASPLQIEDSKTPTVTGEPIPHVAMCGEFRTTAGLPMAKFSYEPKYPFEGEEITFTSESTDPGTSIVAWDWDFGDESTGTGPEVTHTYAESGEYTVTLTVTDDDTIVDTQWRILTVYPVPPPGADLLSAYAEYRKINIRARDSCKLFAEVINLDEEDDVLVRLLFFVYHPDLGNVGTLEVEGTVGAGETAMFEVTFYLADFGEFKVDPPRDHPRIEFEFRAECWYNDYDLPDMTHHWTQIEDPTEIWFSMIGKFPGRP